MSVVVPRSSPLLIRYPTPDAAGDRLAPKQGVMLSRDHSGEDAQTSGNDDVVVIPLAKLHRTQLGTRSRRLEVP